MISSTLDDIFELGGARYTRLSNTGHTYPLSLRPRLNLIVLLHKGGNVGGDYHHISRKLPNSHRLRTGSRNGDKSSSHFLLDTLLIEPPGDN